MLVRSRIRSRVPALLAAMALAAGPLAGVALAAPPPTAVDDTDYSTPEDTQLTVSAPGVLSNDSAPATGNDVCVGTVDASNLHGSLEWFADGSFTYTPSLNYHGERIDNSFIYTIYEVPTGDPCADNQGSTATVQIAVTSVNDAPTASPDSFLALKNTTLVINAPGVLSNDSDVDGDPLTAVKVNNPTHGVVVLAADGSFSYTPATNFTGTDTFSYKASDGTATSPTRVVTIGVSGIPPVPTPTPVPTPLVTFPTPGETLTPIITPPAEMTPEPGASPTEFVPPTPQLSGVPAPSASAAATSLAPGRTAVPGDASGGGSGSPLTLLLGLTLLALIFGVAAAMYGPGWLEARRRRNG